MKCREKTNGTTDGVLVRQLLIVEDDPVLARVMGRFFSAAGWNVTTVHDGESGATQARSGLYSTVLVDLQLPRASGLSVLNAAHDALPFPPSVIVLSGFLDVPSTLSALKNGATEVLEKPVEPRRLLSFVEQAEEKWSGKPSTLKIRSSNVMEEICGDSRSMQQLREQISTVARYTELPVMVVGETGTGKELVAQAVHRLSENHGAFVGINCASVPEELFESELFGHDSGAFTGAKAPRAGLLESAGTGTVFLDEVGEMPLSQQAKLLRVLETRMFRRVGSNREIPLRARIVSATNRVLVGRKGDTQMRTDLFFRLAGFTIHTPPLREHMDDISMLVRVFLMSFANDHSGVPTEISPAALEALCSYHWPGNIRELKAVVLHSAVRATCPAVSVRDTVEAMVEHGCLDSDGAPSNRESQQEETMNTQSKGLDEVEREMIAKAFQECGRNISRTARRLHIPRTTLRDKLKRIGLR